MLRGGGIQWPCTADAPEGTERLYTASQFNTHTDRCETYGHDLTTGAAASEVQHRAWQPAGRAFLKAVPWTPAPGSPNSGYPLRLTTGRTVYHFHTRTKTGRAEKLNAAAPAAWVELGESDAAELGISEGDLVQVSTPRAAVHLPARITRTRAGTVFVPFHYGGENAANELTMMAWDPVSKQPVFSG